MTVGLILMVQESNFQIKDGNSKLNNSNQACDEASWDTRIFENSIEDKGYLSWGDQKSPLGDQEVAVDFRRELYLLT